MDTEDLVSPFPLAACCWVGQNGLLPRTQQPVLHQPLPRATKIGPGHLGGSGRPGVVPPDGVARGKHRDPVVPGNERTDACEDGGETNPWKPGRVV